MEKHRKTPSDVPSSSFHMFLEERRRGAEGRWQRAQLDGATFPCGRKTRKILQPTLNRSPGTEPKSPPNTMVHRGSALGGPGAPGVRAPGPSRALEAAPGLRVRTLTFVCALWVSSGFGSRRTRAPGGAGGLGVVAGVPGPGRLSPGMPGQDAPGGGGKGKVQVPVPQDRPGPGGGEAVPRAPLHGLGTLWGHFKMDKASSTWKAARDFFAFPSRTSVLVRYLPTALPIG